MWRTGAVTDGGNLEGTVHDLQQRATAKIKKQSRKRQKKKVTSQGILLIDRFFEKIL